MMIDSNGDIRIDCGHRARGNVLADLCNELARDLSMVRPADEVVLGMEVLEAIEAFERRATT